MSVFPSSGWVKRITYTYNPNGTTSVSKTDYSYPYNVTYVTGITRTRVNTPNYKELVEKHLLLPVNSYTRLDKGDTPGSCWLSGKTTVPFTTGGGRYEYTFLLPVAALFVDFTSEAAIRALLTNEEISWTQNKAKAHMLDKINGTEELLAVFLAEAHKTLDMLFSTARSLILHGQHILAGSLGSQYLARYFKGKSAGRSVQQILRDLGDKYLEAYYGWQPLVYDMKNSLEAFFDASTDLPRFRINGYSKYVKETTTRVKGTSGPFSAYGPFEYTLRTTVEYKVNAGGILDFEPLAERPTWLREFGLTPEALPSTIWELVKYSFIVDTFVNLGDTLKNLSLLTIKGHTNSSFFLTERFEVTQTVEDFTWLGSQTSGTFNSIPRVVKFMRRSPLPFSNMHVSLQLNPNPWWVGVGNAAYIFARKGLPKNLRF